MSTSTYKKMASIKSRDTKPERVVKNILEELGHKYKNNVKDLSGKPDIYFADKKKVIFINGCFWHKHKLCKYNLKTPSNPSLRAKISKNVVRDEKVVKELESEKYDVLVIWECEVINRSRTQVHTEQIVEKIKLFLEDSGNTK